MMRPSRRYEPEARAPTARQCGGTTPRSPRLQRTPPASMGWSSATPPSPCRSPTATTRRDAAGAVAVDSRRHDQPPAPRSPDSGPDQGPGDDDPDRSRHAEPTTVPSVIAEIDGPQCGGRAGRGRRRGRNAERTSVVGGDRTRNVGRRRGGRARGRGAAGRADDRRRGRGRCRRRHGCTNRRIGRRVRRDRTLRQHLRRWRSSRGWRRGRRSGSRRGWCSRRRRRRRVGRRRATVLRSQRIRRLTIDRRRRRVAGGWCIGRGAPQGERPSLDRARGWRAIAGSEAAVTPLAAHAARSSTTSTR